MQPPTCRVDVGHVARGLTKHSVKMAYVVVNSGDVHTSTASGSLLIQNRAVGHIYGSIVSSSASGSPYTCRFSHRGQTQAAHHSHCSHSADWDQNNKILRSYNESPPAQLFAGCRNVYVCRLQPHHIELNLTGFRLHGIYWISSWRSRADEITLLTLSWMPTMGQGSAPLLARISLIFEESPMNNRMKHLTNTCIGKRVTNCLVP